MRLKIDGIYCPLAEERIVLPGFNSQRMKSVEEWREGERLELWVVATPEMEQLFNHAEELYRAEAFNDSYHKAELEVDGVVLFSGVVTLCDVVCDKGQRLYHIVVRDGGADWADSLATTRLKDTQVACARAMTLRDIELSWSDDGDVRMLPLIHDSYPEPAATGIYAELKMLAPTDYHPFISVRALIKSMVEASGYKLKSEFLDTQLVYRLMMSGAYPRVNTARAVATMGFKALRSVSTTATAADDGRVDACMPIFASNIGAIVDTVDPDAVDESGEPLSGAYSTGGSLTFEGGEPLFTPTREISVAFDIHLNYTTDYRIVSSRWLKGFDSIYLGNGCYVELALQNRFKDQRSNVTPNMTYTLLIFDYDSTATYSIAGASKITGMCSSVTFDKSVSGGVELMVRHSGDSSFSTYTGDWALYDGYVSTTGRCTVDIVVRTPYELCTPTSPKRFNNIYFEGAEEGQNLTLNPGCSITPIFGGVPGYGERLRFEDIANHDISQADLLNSVMQMFNLRLYTHKPSKSLYVEPYDDLFGGVEVDWRDRQRGDSGVLHESAVDSFMVTRLGYQPADGVTSRLMAEDADDEFGEWSMHVSGYAAKQSVESRINPLFMPTVTAHELISTAPSAGTLVVGDRELIAEDEYIVPRIVLYHGLKSLPAGETWPIPGDNDKYPLVAFHSPDVGMTLCFEDRDGCVGLHSYHDSELRSRATRQVLTTDIYIRPEEYVALFDPESSGATLMSRFRLRFGGNSSLFHLEEVVSYDTTTYIAKCRFRRLLTDS